MPTRLKTATHKPLRTRIEFDLCVDQIAALQLEVDEERATLNAEMAMLQEAAKSTIASKEADITAKLAAAEKYAETERDSLFPGKEKTAKTALAQFGFRLSPPALKPLSSAWPAARSIETIMADGSDQFLSIKTTLDKDRLKADLDDAGLARYGLRKVTRDEFWIEPIRAAGAPSDARLTA